MVTNTVIVIESGIGGMALGFQKAGFHVAAAFEKDKNASDVYKKISIKRYIGTACWSCSRKMCRMPM